MRALHKPYPLWKRTKRLKLPIYPPTVKHGKKKRQQTPNSPRWGMRAKDERLSLQIHAGYVHIPSKKDTTFNEPKIVENKKTVSHLYDV